MIIDIITAALLTDSEPFHFNEKDVSKIFLRNYLRDELEKVFYTLIDTIERPDYQKPIIKKYEEKTINSLRQFLPKNRDEMRKLFINSDNIIKKYASTGTI